MCWLVNPWRFLIYSQVGCSSLSVHLLADGTVCCVGFLIQECVLICFQVDRSAASLSVRMSADIVYQGRILTSTKLVTPVGIPSG